MSTSKNKTRVIEGKLNGNITKGTKTTQRTIKKDTESRIFSVELRQDMVKEAAYYLALGRGFIPGFETEDWLQAEKLIED